MRVSRFKNILIATQTPPNFFKPDSVSVRIFFNRNSPRVEKKFGAVPVGPENILAVPTQSAGWPVRAIREAGILRART